MFQTPILFIIYKNPSITKIVFDKIRELKPTVLFISADGAKTDLYEDVAEITATREVTELIDWDCNIYRRYSEKNLGCKLAVSGAITWFFENVEQGIILEYDCLPSTDFFVFCESLLEKYKNDIQISSITGNNFDYVMNNNGSLSSERNSASYYYSSLAKIWGWATWRRAWNNFDINLSKFQEYQNSNFITNQVIKKKHQKYWMNKIRQVVEGKNKTTWAFIWVFTHLSNKSFCVTPSVNLVSNIGFSDLGTHARNPKDILSNIPIIPMSMPLKTPKVVEINFLADARFTNLLMESEKNDRRIVFLKSLVPQFLIQFYKLIRSFLVRKNIIKAKKGWQL
jgi:hypothetical protein